MTKGIVYLLQGVGCAERLVVSVWSLRQHWNGPVTILTAGQKECGVAALLNRDLDCCIKVLDPERLTDRPMLTKTRLPELTPYDDTAYLDADTVVTGSVDELFGCDLTLVRYAYRTTRHRLPKKWIGEWRGVDRGTDKLVDEQLTVERPFINTGAFGFRKSNRQLWAWPDLAAKAPNTRAVDELAMQLLTSRLPHLLLDERWNRCPSWGKAVEDVRVWHFHGRRHCKPKPNCVEIWAPAFLEACKEGVCDLRDWAGKHDRKLRRWMKVNL